MKKVALMIVAIIAIGLNGISQTETKQKPETKQLIVMVGTANWCPVCRANGPRVKENVISHYMSNEKVKIVVNDLSTDESKAKSKETCEKAGIADVSQKHTATGMIYFIHPVSKEVISEISVAKTNEEITKAFEEAITKI